MTDLANLTTGEEYELTIDGETIAARLDDFTPDGACFSQDLFDDEGEWYDDFGWIAYQQDGKWLHGPSGATITQVRPSH